MTGKRSDARKKTGATRKKKPGRRSSGPKRNALEESLKKAEKAYRILYAVYNEQLPREARDAAKAEMLKGLDPESAAAFTFRFHPDGDAASFARQWIDSIRSSCPETGAMPAFARGRIYCYHCDSVRCEHTSPPGHLSVFNGFTPTGFPVWTDFISKVLEAKDPRIDDLVQDESEIVALCQCGEELMQEQLPVFGKESELYLILGQLIVGYLPLPRGDNNRTVITVQAVQCLDQGRPRLFLNVIGKTPLHEDLIDYLRKSPEPELEGLFKVAEKKLKAARYKPNVRTAGRAGLEAAAQTLLRHLGRSIERTHRQSRRRTRHAVQRGSERPAVGMALKDIEKAQPDRFLYDEIHNTFIVAGPKWRIHIFGQDGRHVTSMYLNRDSFQKRLDTRRWRYATPEEMQLTRSKVEAMGKRNP